MSKILYDEELQNILLKLRGHCEEMHELPQNHDKATQCKHCPLCIASDPNEAGCVINNLRLYSSPADWKINTLGTPVVHKFFQ